MEKIIKYCDAVIESAWLMALIVTPLFFMIEAFRVSEPIKIYVFQSITWVGTTAWIIKGLWFLTSGNLKSIFANKINYRELLLKPFHNRPILVIVAGLVFGYILSTVFSISPLASLTGTYTRLDGLITLFTYLIFFLLILFNLNSREQAERIILVLAAVCFFIDGYAILQHFKLDPYSWPKFEANSRIVSTFGHPIFAAAFLGIATFLILPRAFFSVQSFFQFTDGSHLPGNNDKPKLRTGKDFRIGMAAQPILYILICLLNLAAIWFTVSRGPLLGLIFASACFLVLFFIKSQLKKILYISLALGVLLFSFLVIINISEGPLKTYRDNPFIGPLGHLFDAEAGSGQTRVLIWQGMAKLTGQHPALSFVNQTTDIFNSIRWLVGYGPDSLIYAYESFYDPQVYVLEAPNVIYDRAHNRFWDLFGFYGILGIITEYSLYLSLIFIALRKLGLFISEHSQKLYWGFSIFGGLAGFVLPLLFAKPEYIGISIHLGLLTGLIVVIFQNIFFPSLITKTGTYGSYLFSLGLLSALISHYIELSTGILTVTSSLLFWIISALLLVSDRIFVNNPEPVKEIQNNNSLITEFRLTAINILILSSILLTFGSGFIINSQNSSSVSEVLANGLITIQNPVTHTSYGLLILIFIGSIIGAIILQITGPGQKINWKNVLYSIGAALFLFTVFIFLWAGQLTNIQQNTFLGNDALLIINQWKSLPISLFIVLFILLLVLALFISIAKSPVEKNNSKTHMTKVKISRQTDFLPIFSWLIISYLSVIIIIFLVITLNLMPIQADILYEKLWINTNSGNLNFSTLIYDKLTELSPAVPDYQRFAYQLYMARITNSTVNNEKEYFYKTGIEKLKTAIKLEPLFVYNTEAIADFYRMGGEITNNPAEKNIRYYFSDMNYAAAAKIKPGRVDYWLGWASLCAEKRDIICAQEKIDSALAANNHDVSISQFTGNLYSDYALSLEDSTLQNEAFGKALSAFESEADILLQANKNPESAYVSIANVYSNVNQYEQARTTLLTLINNSNKNKYIIDWKIYFQISELSGKLNDPIMQREYLQKALETSPSDQQAIIKDLLKKILP